MVAEELQQFVIDVLHESKALDITCINVSHLTSITNYMVICCGSSSRHVSSLVNHVVEKAKQHNVSPLGTEGQEQGEWALIDLGSVVVHIMQASVREFYALEKLWQAPASSVASTQNQ